jgi:hypothetical protein
LTLLDPFILDLPENTRGVEMIRTQKIIEVMWSIGMPTNDARFANVYRAAVKVGLNDAQAFELTKEAYYAAKGYDFMLAGDGQPIFTDKCGLRRETIKRNALEHPQGKCAEDLAAENEGRPSRWGTEEFHRAG